MHRRVFRHVPHATLANTLCAVLLSAFPMSLSAQAAGSASPVPPGTVISVNPFLPLAGYFQGEFERRFRENLTFALGASYVEDTPDDRNTNVDAKLRFYPQEKAPYGLGLAAGLGIGSRRVMEYRDVSCLAIGCPEPGGRIETTRYSPAISVEITYQWLLGRKQHTAIGFGVGAKRYVAGWPFPDFMPTGRLTIGYAF